MTTVKADCISNIFACWTPWKSREAWNGLNRKPNKYRREKSQRRSWEKHHCQCCFSCPQLDQKWCVWHCRDQVSGAAVTWKLELWDRSRNTSKTSCLSCVFSHKSNLFPTIQVRRCYNSSHHVCSHVLWERGRRMQICLSCFSSWREKLF